MKRFALFGCVYLLGLGLHVQAAPPPEKPVDNNALNLIEGVRGGRHWVDEETAPPKSPQESLASLQIEPGYEIQLFAAEPLVARSGGDHVRSAGPDVRGRIRRLSDRAA